MVDRFGTEVPRVNQDKTPFRGQGQTVIATNQMLKNNFHSNDANMLQQKLAELEAELAGLDKEYDSLQSENEHLKLEHEDIKSKNKMLFEQLTAGHDQLGSTLLNDMSTDQLQSNQSN